MIMSREEEVKADEAYKGYTNVAMYDGSSQDFMKYPNFPIEQFRW